MPHKWKVFDRLVIFLPCQPLSGRGRDHMMVGQRKWSKNIYYLQKTTGKEKKKNRHILSTQLRLFSFMLQKRSRGKTIQCTHKMISALLRSNMQCCFWKHSYSITYPTIFMVGSSPVHNQNLQWKLGQQTPSAGTFFAYIETYGLNYIFLGIKLFCFSR